MTRKTHTWLALAVVGIALVPALIMGLFAYMSYTAGRVHPDERQVPSVAQGPLPPDEWAGPVERARQIVRGHISELNVPGLSVAVGSGGEIIWAEGFGYADLESRSPVTPETGFRIGTASIALTSAAVGLLLETDRLRLDEKIQVYVPAFPPKPWPVTLRQVMAHTAGIRSDSGDEGPLLATHCERTADGLDAFRGDDLLFEPGTAYRYSRYGWILMSAAVEAAAGEPFFSFMRRRVFEPLGMRDTNVDATGAGASSAVAYFPRFAADPRYGIDLMRPIDLSCYSGSSAFVSTPSDLVRFSMAIDGGTLLQPATVQRLQAPQLLRSGEETGYGLGWDLETVTLAGQEVRVIGHDGDVLGGTAVSLLAVPGRDTVVAITSNIPYAGTFDLAVKVAEVFAAGETGRR